MVKIFLPLLFADGQPTSLEKITLNQMERFVPFMLSCCPDYSGNTPPAWWPSLVAYRFPLCSVGNSQQRTTCYKELISRCYEFHKCEHVLRFCSRLAEIPPDLLQYKENAHDFVSIYNTVNNKLIVTYKKKNQIYDRPPASPFKSLLPKIYKTNQPPTDQHIEDIYLCNYCDEEFTSGKEAIAHESVCTGKVDDKLLNNEALDQVSAMRYFGLGPCNKKALIATPSKRGTSIRLTARSYMPIPISSPLGLKMSSNVTLLDEGDKLSCVRKVENLCKAMKTCTESLSKRPKRIGGNPRFMKRKFRSSIWVHTYCFNKAQREEKMTTLRTGLNKQARLLLEKCKPAVVLIEKLPLLDPLALHAAASLNFPTSSLNGAKLKEEAEEIIPSEAQDEICVDLTYGEGSIYSNNIEDCTYSSSSSDSFFYSSSSNHKRPSIDDWGSLFSMKPLLQV